jgi:ADP-ribosylglycohydrolase
VIGNADTATLEHKAIGMLAGVALGDALGMPTEFLSQEYIEKWYGRINGLVAPHPQHIHHRLRAGEVTDDTDQTHIIAKLLIENGSIEGQQLAESLLAWSETPRVRQNRFVGPSTSKTLEALKQGLPWDQVPRAGTSVGAAMRVAPIAIVFADAEALAGQVVASCEASHYTSKAISGAMAMAFALRETLNQAADPRSVARAAQEGAVHGRKFGNWSWTPPIERRIEHVLSWAAELPKQQVLTQIQELIGVDLYPEQLVPATIGLVVLARGAPMVAMMMAANLGGDTDTLASMAGSICGALQGIGAFEEGMLAEVEAVNGLDLKSLARSLLALRRR